MGLHASIYCNCNVLGTGTMIHFLHVSRSAGVVMTLPQKLGQLLLESPYAARPCVEERIGSGLFMSDSHGFGRSLDLGPAPTGESVFDKKQSVRLEC